LDALSHARSAVWNDLDLVFGLVCFI